MNWIMTIPKRIDWTVYMREVRACEDNVTVLNYRVSFKPNVQRGDRMYVVHNGCIRGWMHVNDVKHWPEGFRCTTTGIQWKSGWYIQRTGSFHPVVERPCKGFRGYRRLDDPPPRKLQR